MTYRRVEFYCELRADRGGRLHVARIRAPFGVGVLQRIRELANAATAFATDRAGRAPVPASIRVAGFTDGSIEVSAAAALPEQGESRSGAATIRTSGIAQEGRRAARVIVRVYARPSQVDAFLRSEGFGKAWEASERPRFVDYRTKGIKARYFANPRGASDIVFSLEGFPTDEDAKKLDAIVRRLRASPHCTRPGGAGDSRRP